jgi:hypothetical protein
MPFPPNGETHDTRILGRVLERRKFLWIENIAERKKRIVVVGLQWLWAELGR